MRSVVLSLVPVVFYVIVSCQKPDTPPPTPQPQAQLKVDSTTLYLSGIKNSLDSFTIQYSGNWAIAINPSTATWLKTHVTAGTGNTKVYVSVEQDNTSGTARTATIIVTPNGDAAKAITIAVSQKVKTSIFSPFKNVYGGTSNDQFASVIPAADGGYIGVGTTQSNDGDVSGNHGIQDIWVVRVDKNGNKVWQKTYGGSDNDYAQGAVATSDGGVLIVGAASSNNGDVSGNHGSSDMWVLKIDGNGNIVWQKTFGGTKLDYALAVTQSNDGGYLLAGVTQSTDGDVTQNHGIQDIWLVKINGTGNKQWQKTYGGTNYETPFSVAKTLEGGYVVVGNMTDYVSNGEANLFVYKVDGNGNLLWQKIFAGSGVDTGRSIITTTDGKYVITGFTTSNNGDFTGNHGRQDAWILRLDENGNKIWLKTYGGTGVEEATSLIATADGDFVMAGQTGSNDGDVSGNHGGNDAWIIKVDGTGGIIWQKTFGGSGDDKSLSLIATQDGVYVFTGQTSSTDGDIVGQHGAVDAWIVKFKD